MNAADDGLAGRAVLVTGGTRGLGAAVSRELAARGARVTAWYRADREAAERTAAEVRSRGGEIAIDAGNLGDPGEVRRMVAALVAREPRISGVVHCAALGSFKSPLALKPAQFELTVNVGARSFLLLAQELAPGMPRGARLIALSSLGATRVVPSYGAIGFAKATLEAMVRELAVELAPRGIRVHTVTAGPVEGSSIRMHPDYEAFLERLRARTPSGHLATAEETARVVAWLFSPLVDALNGQTLVVDGGLSLPL